MHRHYRVGCQMNLSCQWLWVSSCFPLENNHWTKTITSTSPLSALAVRDKTEIQVTRGIWTEVLRLGRSLDWSQLWSPQLQTVNRSVSDLKREGKPWRVGTMDECFYTWTVNRLNWCAVPLWKKIEGFIQKPPHYLKVPVLDPVWSQFHAAFSNVLIHNTNHH